MKTSYASHRRLNAVPHLAKVFTPFILVNFKGYLESICKRALELAKAAERASIESGVCIGVAPQFVDIAKVAEAVSIPVFAQHIDPIPPGAYTGYVLPEAVKEAGAVGTLINHSERQLTFSDVDIAVRRAREVGLTSIVCVTNSRMGAAVASLQPNMIAIEPRELIGTYASISKIKPDVIAEAVELVRGINPRIRILCGAGIANSVDVIVVLRLGADGIIVASDVVKAKDPYEVLSKLAKAAVNVQSSSV